MKITPPLGASTHAPDPGIIHLELHRLLASVLSFPLMLELITEEHQPSDPMSSLLDAADPEITRLLLSTAVMLRAKDEELGVEATDTEKWRVGRLTQESEKALSLREACNKIIHPKLIWFGPAEGADLGAAPLVQLLGDYRSKEWHAEVDVRRYCRLGALLAGMLGSPPDDEPVRRGEEVF